MALITKFLTACAIIVPVFNGAAEKGKIVWIISADLRPELACYGYPDVATPNIDRLAETGTVGGHHYDSCDKRRLPEFATTVTQVMQKAGYVVSHGRGVAAPENRFAKSRFNFI